MRFLPSFLEGLCHHSQEDFTIISIRFYHHSQEDFAIIPRRFWQSFPGSFCHHSQILLQVAGLGVPCFGQSHSLWHSNMWWAQSNHWVLLSPDPSSGKKTSNFQPLKPDSNISINPGWISMQLFFPHFPPVTEGLSLEINDAFCVMAVPDKPLPGNTILTQPFPLHFQREFVGFAV